MEYSGKYNHLYWDIIGLCNSKCPYCCNGGNSIAGPHHKSKGGVLSPEDFDKSLNYLLSNGIISPRTTEISLYNWGEVFLHPQFEKMLDIVADKGFNLSLSTNGSIVKVLSEKVIHKLFTLRFSMPGFSQESYDKIHGFRFDKILYNIQAIVNQIRNISRNPKISICIHHYKFNEHELELADKFCKEVGIYFHHFNALFGGLSLWKCITDKDVFLDRIEAVGKRRTKDWECPQPKVLVLDEYCNVLQCCGTDRSTEGHVIGNLYEVDFNTLMEKRKNAEICKWCSKNNIDYIGHNL